jgi:hypothetical protein
MTFTDGSMVIAVPVDIKNKAAGAAMSSTATTIASMIFTS